MSAGERREGSGDPDDQNGQTDPADDDALSSVSPDSEAPPISPARRRLGICSTSSSSSRSSSTPPRRGSARGGRPREGLKEYFLAGKTIRAGRPALDGGHAVRRGHAAAGDGLVATAGVFALWRLWIYGLAFLLMAFVFAVGWRARACSPTPS
jgi:hypothetical protein